MNGDLEPIPETVEAIEEFGPFSYGQADLLPHLRQLAAHVRRLVPACVGLSVTLRALDATFTLAATDRRIAVLDAVQYLDGGPCVDAVETDVTVTSTIDSALDEDRWRLFSAAKAARHVQSTLSLPIVDHVAGGDTVVGGFNLYAATPDAFEGRHDALGDVLGAWATGATTNSDLSFDSREMARRAPHVLREGFDLTLATHLLAQGTADPPEDWEQRLRDAAVRAGVPLRDLVSYVLTALREESDDDGGA